MKQGKRMLFTTLFAAMSTVVFAQAGGGGGGGNGNSGTGSGNAHGAATAGMTSGDDPASGLMSKGGKTHRKMTHKSATDTTKTPGANASSDTKGQ